MGSCPPARNAQERARFWRIALVLWLGLLAASATAAAGEADLLLPDIIVRPADLFDHDVVTSIQPGRRHLRLSNGTANIGAGKLHLFGVTPANPDGTQPVMQRIARLDGSHVDRPAGDFVFHPAHNHIHIEDWSRYRLRGVVGDGEVGEIVAEGEKVSFCILDLAVFDSSLPNFDSRPVFVSCGSTVQGLSVGWIDIYSKVLPGQNIDITGLPDGFYWLESEVDPEDHVLEENEENNVTRIRVTIGNPPEPPDAYEPNDRREDVGVLPVGLPNSSNLGPCNPKRIIQGLNVHVSGNDDYFRFYANETGTGRNFVRIDFDNDRGNLGLELLDESGVTVGSADGLDDIEVISLVGVPEGWYTARVFGRGGAVNPDYMFTVVPPQNAPPTVTVLTPPAGDSRFIHGSDSYNITWAHSDPDGDSSWVTVYLNTHPVLDGNEEVLPSALFTDAALSLAVVNSAEFEPGTYWVYCQVTDGGSTSGSWSEGTVTFVDLPEGCTAALGSPEDCNHNSVRDACEIETALRADCDGNGAPDECDLAAGAQDSDENGVLDACERPRFHRGDTNQDGDLDLSDASNLFTYLFLRGATPGCLETADANNDASLNVTDGIVMLNYLFLGRAPLVAPGPPPSPCGFDPDPLGSAGDLGCERYDPCP